MYREVRKGGREKEAKTQRGTLRLSAIFPIGAGTFKKSPVQKQRATREEFHGDKGLAAPARKSIEQLTKRVSSRNPWTRES